MEAGDQVEGTVVRVTADTVFLNIGAKSEGFMERQEFGEEAPAIGTRLDVFVTGVGDSIRLSRELRGEASWEGVHQAFESGATIDGRVESTNPGGLVVKLGDVRAFCPISQIARNVPSDLSSYVGQTLAFKIREVKEREVVVSHREIADAELEARSESLWAQLSEGDTLDGVVSNVRDFGAFVDVGGIEGLVPRSELGWTRKAEAPEPGTQVSVRVLSVDRLAKRLSLSLKDQSADPWALVGRTFLPGGVYPGKVTRLTDFGAFISLAPGLEGLAHISKLSSKRIGHPKEVLEVGQELEIRIDEIDAGRQRLSLAIPREGDAEAQTQAHVPQKEQSLGTLADLFGGIELPK
jgi:small subunit ribosomal protein S1